MNKKYPIVLAPLIRKCLEQPRYLPLSGRLNVGVTGVTDDIINFLHGTMGNRWEGRLTVICKITINLPRFSKVCRPLDDHGSWSKRLKGENEV